MVFMKSLKLSGLLSFPPNAEAIELTPLNVLIGPNGSGKSNFIEAFELLHALPTSFASAIREGGGIKEWLWKGDCTNHKSAEIESIINRPEKAPLRYCMKFAESGYRAELIDEVLEDVKKKSSKKPSEVYYHRNLEELDIRTEDVRNKNRFSYLKPVISSEENILVRDYKFITDESLFSQIKGPTLYPHLTWVGREFSRIKLFREWRIGRYSELRQPQPADLPSDMLSEDSRNLGLILSELEHSNARNEFYSLLARFLPRYERFSTRIIGGTVQFYLHEQGLRDPIPASRLSDGTIRFMAMLALLLSPTPPSMLCMEEPELGLHPDALYLLADLLAEASTRMQIVVTTHSDALLSALTDHADSVLVCEHLGGTAMKRLESEKLQHWLDRYRLGELWLSGKLGGNP
jgi:predicted ATPase